MTDQPFEVPSTTPNFQTELANKLAELCPEIITDGKIDFDTLKTLLNTDIAGGGERFGLFWPGKTQAIRAAQTPTTATLAPDFENSINWDNTQNIFIEGDNLEVLKILQKHYYGKIKMIYIDPPYNTGKDFIYEDNYTDPIGSYLDMTGQRDGQGRFSTNTESDGRFHTKWLNMMYPRLKLARNLLSDSGIILMSIDDTEYSNAASILKEIFGENNVIGTLIHQRAKGGGQAKYIVKGHDYILIASRNIDKMSPLMRRKVIQGRTVFIDGVEYIKDDDVVRRSFGKYDRNKDRRCFYEELEELKGIDKKNQIDLEIENGRLFLEWRQDVQMHVIYKLTAVSDATSKIYSIIKALSEKGQQDLDDLKLEGCFTYPKSIELMLQLLESTVMLDKEAIILDFFAGSGTTGHAIMALNAIDNGNRRCISVQIPETTDGKEEAKKIARSLGYSTISEITRERIRRAGKKILEEEAEKLAQREIPLDTGFRAYKLVDTNFTKWRANSSMPKKELVDLFTTLGDSADDDANPEALLTEVLLKLGFSLTEKIETINVAGLEAYSIADGLLIAYMDEFTKPTLDQLRALVNLEPERLVILEDAFQGYDELKTNLTQECRTRGVDLWTA